MDTTRWKTSDRELAQELISCGHTMLDQEMVNLTAYFVFEWNMGLAEEILLSKVIMEHEDGLFSTSDISLVAFLKFKGYMPHDTRVNSDGSRGSVIWVFEDTDEIVECVSEFFGVVHEVDLRLYNEQVANTRSYAITERNAQQRAATTR